MNLRVVLVEALLVTPVHWIVPPEPLVPPIYPAAAVPEQPLHETFLAPPDIVAASPSYEFSEGPAVMEPLLTSTTQFRYQLRVAVDPLIVRGSQI